MSRDADNLDVASELQDAFNKRGIAAIAARTAPEKHEDFDGKHCLDCPTEIPAMRLAMGRIRCVLCQTAVEKRQRFQR